MLNLIQHLIKPHNNNKPSLRGTKQSHKRKPTHHVSSSKMPQAFCIENPSTTPNAAHQTQIPTQSEPAVSSIYKQNPLRMAEAMEAIIVMLNLIQHLI
jgi:hypothetical protein